MLIDTHCHLHDREFYSAEQAEDYIKNAHKNGVKKMVCIGTSHEDSLAAKDFASAHNNIYWTYGVHPEYAGTFSDEKLPSDSLLVAIGEVGLDYHYEGHNREAQIKLFEKMLQLAVDNDLSVSFHVREAFNDFFAVVNNFPTVRGVVHSFSDNKKNLKKILDNTEFFVGVNGMATYSTLPTPPLERIVLETDAPFLTPAPYRDRINESKYIKNIAEWLSIKLGVEFAIIEKETTKNADRLFRFPSSRVNQHEGK